MNRIELFSLNGRFLLYDFNNNHNQLIIRNPQLSKNIDILFKGVAGLNIFSTFSDIRISAIDYNSKLIANHDGYSPKFLFEIECLKSHSCSFINAAVCAIFENNFPFGITNVEDISRTGNKQIFTSNDHREFINRYGIKV